MKSNMKSNMESKETSYINHCIRLIERPSFKPDETMLEWIRQYLSSSYRSGYRYFHYNPKVHGEIVSYGITKEKGNPLGKNTLLVVYFKTCDSCEEVSVSLREFKKFCRRNHLSRKNILKIDLTPTELKAIDAFMKKHEECFSTSTIGGKYSFIVTHTGLGPLVDIKCNICGEIECVTDISKL